MTLENAIEILKERGIPWGGIALQKHYEAKQLGIEALEFRQMCEKRGIRFAIFPLPGETKE